MVYLSVFTFPNDDMEFDFFMKIKEHATIRFIHLGYCQDMNLRE